MRKLSTILDQIDSGTMLLPEFQRGYVWNRDQVRGLMRSLYKGYPVGSLLVWETDGINQAVRGGSWGASGAKNLLLDGQQRVTTLYGIVRGRAPSFFDGDPQAFQGLQFNVSTEAFHFYAPGKMKSDPLWIDVTKLFVEGPAEAFGMLHEHAEAKDRLPIFIDRLQRLLNLLERPFQIEEILGEDKTVDVVVDIFNRVNSGGTKLSKGDLALARVCAEWGEARPTMRRNLDRWADQGYHFRSDWLLRNVNAVATGRAPFSALEETTAEQFAQSLDTAVHSIDFLLDLVGKRLGLDHDRVLNGRYAFPVIVKHLRNSGGRFVDDEEVNRALYWYVQAALRGRFAGATETALAADLDTVDAGGFDGLISNLRRLCGGTLAIEARDFEGVGRGARSYPLLYLLTRVRASCDLASGRPLGREESAVRVHEIFPKAELAKHGYTRSEINAVANFAFLDPASATELAEHAPAEYLQSCGSAVLASQWIPQDAALWRVENYRQFLAARQELLAAEAHEFLDGLLAGTHVQGRALEAVGVTEDSVAFTARAAQISALVSELVATGYAQPSLDVEIADPETGSPLSVAEVYWPNGFQMGQGNPVVLELDPDEADLPRLAELGFEVFTTVDALRGFIQRRNEVASGDRETTGVDSEVTEEIVAEVVVPSAGEEQFEAAVRQVVQCCEDELGYNPRKLRVMIGQHGAVGATSQLLAQRAVSDAFVLLWERQRLDLSIEALVCDQRFEAIFTQEERKVAWDRLDEFGYSASAA